DSYLIQQVSSCKALETLGERRHDGMSNGSERGGGRGGAPIWMLRSTSRDRQDPGSNRPCGRSSCCRANALRGQKHRIPLKVAMRRDGTSDPAISKHARRFMQLVPGFCGSY